MKSFFINLDKKLLLFIELITALVIGLSGAILTASPGLLLLLLLIELVNFELFISIKEHFIFLVLSLMGSYIGRAIIKHNDLLKKIGEEWKKNFKS